MRRPFRSTAFAALAGAGLVIGLLCMIAALPTWFTAPVAVPLVLVLTGLSLTYAAFPPAVIGGEVRTLVAIGLSIASVVALSFALDALGLPLTRATLGPGLAAICVLGALVADARSDGPALRLPARFGRTAAVNVALGCVALAVVVVALGLARTTPASPLAQGYTTLSLVPAANGGPGALRVGVESYEDGETNYRLELSVDGETALTRRFALAPGGSRETLVVPEASTSGPVTATLYRDGESTIYRRARVNLPVKAQRAELLDPAD
ncbi:MAG: DUF1616 domain-containing protein [Thermoleophilia bacterium]|nr:DUF1616 domain-containing protein [Thermoleophilia bacterium]